MVGLVGRSERRNRHSRRRSPHPQPFSRKQEKGACLMVGLVCRSKRRSAIRQELFKMYGLETCADVLLTVGCNFGT